MPVLRCETCRRDMLFEVPPCADGHGTDCPELVCTGCGAALLRTWLASLAAPVEAPRQRNSRSVPRQLSTRRVPVRTGAAHGRLVSSHTG